MFYENPEIFKYWKTERSKIEIDRANLRISTLHKSNNNKSDVNFNEVGRNWHLYSIFNELAFV